VKRHWARDKQAVYFITNTIVGWKTIFVTARSIERTPPPPLPLYEKAGFRRESAKRLLAHFREAGRIVNQTYRIWLPDDQPEMIFTQKFFEQKLAYLHGNPVEAKIATAMNDYPYSSAAFYSTGKEGLIPLGPMSFLG